MVDYDIELQNHPGKVNVIPDTLSKKLEAQGTTQLTQHKEILKEIMKLDIKVVQQNSATDQLVVFQI